MRHTHTNEVCTCEPVNRVQSCLRNALLWMECTCVSGTGRPTRVRIRKTHSHLWMEIRTCERELAIENRATYLLTGHLRCDWDLIPSGGSRGGSGGGSNEPPLEPKLFHFHGEFQVKLDKLHKSNPPSANLNPRSKNPGSAPDTYERDHSRLDETGRLSVYKCRPHSHLTVYSHEDVQITRGGPRTANPQPVNGISTCERDMYVWTGPVLGCFLPLNFHRRQC